METQTKEQVTEAEFTAVEAPTTNLPARIEPAVPLHTPVVTERGQLARALVEAQTRCEAAGKDRKNTHHGYKYASAEEIITVGKVALGNAGLALVPIGAHVNGHAKEGEGRFELEREFLLMHVSGETMPLKCHWPICPEKGRPLDKATAIADTLSLSYLIRDLLLMPRIDETDDVNNDGLGNPTPPKPAPAKNGTKPAKPVETEEPTSPPEPSIGPDDLERLTELIGSLPTDPERIPSLYRRFKVKDLKHLRAGQYQDAVRFITGNLPITSEQQTKIRATIDELKVGAKQVKERLHDLYRVETLGQLKRVQADDLLNRLAASKAVKTTPTPAGAA